MSITKWTIPCLDDMQRKGKKEEREGEHKLIKKIYMGERGKDGIKLNSTVRTNINQKRFNKTTFST